MSDKILSKVKNLLELSQNNANVNEAAVAYKAAQKLLSENRLSMADVECFDDSLDEPVEEGPLYEGKRAITWKGSLAHGIAHCNGCEVYWDNHGYKKKLTLVGRSSDISIVRWLYSLVSNQIEMFCKAALISNGGGGKTFSNNFKRGAVDSVLRRLQEAKREVEQKYEGSQALVFVKKKDEAINQHMSKLNLRSKKTTARYDRRGYSAGIEAGKRVDLSRGKVSSSTKGYLN